EARGREARRENESVERIRKIGRRLGERCRIGRIKANARSSLREDGLKDAAVENTEAAANRKFSVAAGQCAKKAIAIPIRRVGESETRIDVAAAAKAVVDQAIALLRRADVLVAGAEVQNDIVRRTPVILRVDVLFAQLVLQIGRPE